tara:strand:+ start:265 stop:870 length:606 start_codon:yes stop_codon:yes gene_type:complete
MGANERQVGGSHYSSELQHWDVIEDNGIGYLEAAATKYVTRAFKKNGAEDVEKAIHYTEKLLEKFQAGTRLPRGEVDLDTIEQFCAINKMSKLQHDCIYELFTWSQEQDLVFAIACLKELREKVLEEPPTQTLDDTTRKVLASLGNASMQDGLTVLTNVMGHIVAHQSEGKPSLIKSISADLTEAVRISAIGKIMHDVEER